jgi:hypothetical protein
LSVRERARSTVHPELVFHVDLRSGEEDVDAGVGGVPDCLPSLVDVSVDGSGQGGDGRALYLPGDSLDGAEVARGGDRESGLDDVDAEPGQLRGDGHLLVGVEGDPGCLFAVSQGAVEDPHASFHVSS